MGYLYLSVEVQSNHPCLHSQLNTASSVTELLLQWQHYQEAQDKNMHHVGLSIDSEIMIMCEIMGFLFSAT